MLKRSTRHSQTLDLYVPSIDYVMLIDCKEPSYYKESLPRDDKLKWEKAMQPEIDSFCVTTPHGSWSIYMLVR